MLQLCRSAYASGFSLDRHCGNVWPVLSPPIPSFRPWPSHFLTPCTPLTGGVMPVDSSSRLQGHYPNQHTDYRTE